MITKPVPVPQREGPLRGTKILVVGPMFSYPESLSLFYQHAFVSLGATIGGLCTRTSRPWGDTGFKPDVALFIKGEQRPEIVKEIKQAYGCKTILYFPDALEDYSNYESSMGLHRSNLEHLKTVRSWYDELFLAIYYPKEQFDELNAKWLPVAYDPMVHFPVEPAPAKPTAVMFIGSLKPGREFVADLKPMPEVWGNSWGQYFKTQDVYLDQKRKLTSEARIMLNEHHANVGPNHRDTECGGYRSFMISDRVDGMDALGLRNGEHYIAYSDPADCQAKITDWLERDHEQRELIASNLHELVKEKHTYAARALEMLK